MLKPRSPMKSVLRKCGVELKRFTFGLDLREDLKMLHAERQPKVIFDIGANEGQTALSLHELFPEARLYSFEPSSRVFVKLKQNVANYSNITPVQAAMGSKEGRVALKITNSSVMSSLLTYQRPNGVDKVIEEEEVAVRTIAAFCQENKIERIDVLKIDTQGFDLEVLRGAEPLLKAHRVGSILCEVNCVPMYEGQAWFHDIVAFLASCGIQFCGLYGINRETDRFMHWADSLYIDPKFSQK
ncbi:MAG: methyltransferase FkbM family [Verrucomicrobiales bacterium]|nr:methyltransferase FkbM family [Verrucomicrobiales bacterium]